MISIQPGESLDLELLGSGHTIRVTHHLNQDGHSIEVEGVDCDLEGEMPGLYYLAPSGTIAARFAPQEGDR